MNDDPVHIWQEAVREPEIDHAIRAVHEEIARATAQQRPRCDVSGRCCRFEAFGHRLYTTGLEVAWTLARVHEQGGTLSFAEVRDAHANGTCPFLVEGRCSIHASRPMGCRVFFCDESARDWQRDLYEKMQTEIRSLHDRHGIPYEYGEWRSLLAAFTSEPVAGDRETIDNVPPRSAIEPPSPLIQLRIAP